MSNNGREIRERLELCDGGCNNCPLINNRNTKLLAYVLSTIVAEFPKANQTIQDFCPNLSVCPECRVDDFTHVEDCKLGAELDV